MVKFLTATTSFVVAASLLLLCWCCKHHGQGTVHVGLLFQEDGCGMAWRAASTQAKSLHLQKQAWSGRGNRSGMRPFKSLSLLPLMYFLWQDWTTQTSPDSSTHWGTRVLSPNLLWKFLIYTPVTPPRFHCPIALWLPMLVQDFCIWSAFCYSAFSGHWIMQRQLLILSLPAQKEAGFWWRNCKKAVHKNLW